MPRSPSTAPWATEARSRVRAKAACPTCHAPQGYYCKNDDGGRREANHAARHEAATGEDPTKYAYGAQRARQARSQGRKWERRTPGGW